MPEKYVLMQYRSLPMEAKVTMTQVRIREWYDHWNGDVMVSFSGGKDSTVLAHLVHDMYPNVPLVFSNTGLEYPEIQAFARKAGAEFVRPKMQFSDVISKYGYPIISKENADVICRARKIFNGAIKPRAGYGQKKSNGGGEYINCRRKMLHGIKPFDKGLFKKTKWLPLARDTQFMISNQCCQIMKKDPLSKYEKEKGLYPIIGTLTEESKARERSWIRLGCNAFEGKTKTSQPMSFWTEQDVLNYIKTRGLEICSVYGDVVETAKDADGYEYENILPGSGYLKCSKCQRTGCIFCGFGVHQIGRAHV